MSPSECKSEGGWIEFNSGDPVTDAIRTVLNFLEYLYGHPVTGLQAVNLVPVASAYAEELDRIERGGLT